MSRKMTRRPVPKLEMFTKQIPWKQDFLLASSTNVADMNLGIVGAKVENIERAKGCWSFVSIPETTRIKAVRDLRRGATRRVIHSNKMKFLKTSTTPFQDRSRTCRWYDIYRKRTTIAARACPEEDVKLKTKGRPRQIETKDRERKTPKVKIPDSLARLAASLSSSRRHRELCQFPRNAPALDTGLWRREIDHRRLWGGGGDGKKAGWSR
eukprot:g4577.t1